MNGSKKLWYIYKMEYYAAERKGELLPFVIAWIEVESIMLSEISLSPCFNMPSQELWRWVEDSSWGVVACILKQSSFSQHPSWLLLQFLLSTCGKGDFPNSRQTFTITETFLYSALVSVYQFSGLWVLLLLTKIITNVIINHYLHFTYITNASK